MKLKEAFDKNLPLLIEVHDNGKRIIAEGFIVEGGIVFWDIWWYEASFHPIHFIKGDIVGDGPWTIGKNKIRGITKDDPARVVLDQWIVFLNSHEGKDATRELAKEFTQENYKLI